MPFGENIPTSCFDGQGGAALYSIGPGAYYLSSEGLTSKRDRQTAKACKGESGNWKSQLNWLLLILPICKIMGGMGPASWSSICTFPPSCQYRWRSSGSSGNDSTIWKFLTDFCVARLYTRKTRGKADTAKNWVRCCNWRAKRALKIEHHLKIDQAWRQCVIAWHAQVEGRNTIFL